MDATRLLAATLTLFSLGAASGCSGSNRDPYPAPSALDSGMAATWMDQLYANIQAAALTPPVASRAIAYTGVTLYEAVVPGMPSHQSLAGQLNDLDSVPQAPGDLHWPTVVNAAMARIQRNLFSTSATVVANIDALEAQQDAALRASVRADTYAGSVAWGRTMADAIWTWSAGDGFSTYNNCTYTVPTGPGLWVPTPPAFQANPLQPCWGQLRPFVLLFGLECSVPAPPAYSETAGSKFWNEALEVQDTVNALTSAQLDIARFWADGGGTGTPPGHWVRIVSQVAQQHGLSLETAVEAYVRVGVAVADAFISCWDCKYVFNLLRPITYIRSATALNNPAWNTPITTPPFPEYTSGHSTQSGAAALVLDDLLGSLPFTDNTHAALGYAARSFPDFFTAADEAAISRLYGGIHFRQAIERGVDQGYCIGRTILDHVAFRKP